jgi:hypothetical protein
MQPQVPLRALPLPEPAGLTGRRLCSWLAHRPSGLRRAKRQGYGADRLQNGRRSDQPAVAPANGARGEHLRSAVADDVRDPALTCQGCRPRTHTSLDDRGLIKCPLCSALRTSSRTLRKGREVPNSDIVSKVARPILLNVSSFRSAAGPSLASKEDRRWSASSSLAADDRR